MPWYPGLCFMNWELYVMLLYILIFCHRKYENPSGSVTNRKFQVNAVGYLGLCDMYVSLYLASWRYIYSLNAGSPIRISHRFCRCTLCVGRYGCLLCCTKWKDESKQEVEASQVLQNLRCFVFKKRNRVNLRYRVRAPAG